VSPQLTYQQISAAQVSEDRPSAAQQLSAPQFSQTQEKVPQRTRRPPTSTTVGPASQEEVQLLYVPVETLRQQQQVQTPAIHNYFAFRCGMSTQVYKY
jgi:hypothetical protein